jgi:nucleoside 2-deoxyribosyltransferase
VIILKTIYIAGPLFSEHEREYLIKLVDILSKELGLDQYEDFFLPHRDAGDVGVTGERNEIFSLDLRYLEQAKIVIALLDGQDVDSGTAVELGYAFAKGKKIFGLLTDFRAYLSSSKTPAKLNNMVWGVCDEGKTLFRTIDDLVNAIKIYYQT